MTDTDCISNARNGNAPSFDRTDFCSFAITTILAFSVYLCLLAPDVTLERSGMYATAARHCGVGPPPGYPLWTILGWLFTRLLPFGNIAWRLSVFSACTGALTCGLIAFMVSSGTKVWSERLKPSEEKQLRLVSGYAAGMIFGFNGAYWCMVEVVDVWPLSILLLTVTLCLLMRWTYSPRNKYLYAAWFSFGLAVTNSYALLVLSPAMMLFPLFGQRPRKWWVFAPCVGCFLLGLSLYLLLPIMSMTNPPSNWGYPRTVDGFFHVITRYQYDRIHPTSHWLDYLEQLGMYARVTGREFGWIYLPFAVAPIFVWQRMPQPARKWQLRLLAVFACLSLAMVALLNPGVDDQSAELNKIYFSASYIVLALEVGYGMTLLGALVTKRSERGVDAATPLPA